MRVRLVGGGIYQGSVPRFLKLGHVIASGEKLELDMADLEWLMDRRGRLFSATLMQLRSRHADHRPQPL